MKTIALSMILSLAVIVCEQQTLFAPHFVTFDNLRAQNPSNSLVPIAGVNRLVPVAGKTSSAVAIPALVRPEVSDQRNSMLGCYPEGLEHGPDLHDSLEGIRMGTTGNGFPEGFGPFFGLGGSSDPGGDDI